MGAIITQGSGKQGAWTLEYQKKDDKESRCQKMHEPFFIFNLDKVRNALGGWPPGSDLEGIYLKVKFRHHLKRR